MGQISRADCMAPSSLDLTSMESFLWSTLRSPFVQYLPHLSTILWLDFKQLWRWSMSTCWGVYERVAFTAMKSTLKLMRLLWLLTITIKHPCSDTCSLWHVSSKLNITGHMLYNISNLIFSTESHYSKLVHEFNLILYTIHTANLTYYFLRKLSPAKPWLLYTQ